MTITIHVDVEYVNGAEPSEELLRAALAEHVAKSGQFTFPVDGPGGAFASSRWAVTEAVPS